MKITCHYCGEKVERITKDHIVPLSKDGADKSWNIVPACFPCNSAKANNWPTCDCFRCQRSIQRHGDEGWPAQKLRRIPLGATVYLTHPKGSVLVGRKMHTDVDDLIAVAGLGDFHLHKMKNSGWHISLESEGEANAPRTEALNQTPATQELAS